MIRVIIIKRPAKNIQIWPNLVLVTIKRFGIAIQQLNELFYYTSTDFSLYKCKSMLFADSLKITENKNLPAKCTGTKPVLCPNCRYHLYMVSRNSDRKRA